MRPRTSTLGGCGLTAQADIADAACIGSWALTWRPMRRLCPHLFGGVDITRAPQQVFAELREAHARVLERHRRVAAVYAQWDQAGVYWDFDTAGEGHHRFHPDGLADQKELLPLAKFGTDEDYLKYAQRRFSSVIHHSSWRRHPPLSAAPVPVAPPRWWRRC